MKAWRLAFRSPAAHGGLIVIPVLGDWERGSWAGCLGRLAEPASPGFSERSCSINNVESSIRKTLKSNLYSLHVCAYMCMGSPTHIQPHRCKLAYAHTTYTFICTCKIIREIWELWTSHGLMPVAWSFSTPVSPSGPLLVQHLQHWQDGFPLCGHLWFSSLSRCHSLELPAENVSGRNCLDQVDCWHAGEK